MFSHMAEDVWGWAWATWPAQIPRPNENWAQGVGVIIGIALIVWAWSRERYFDFISQVVVEVSQIIWPTRAETRAATIVVVIITLICSGILAFMDTFWLRVTDWLYAL
ncbi:preprotein translocase subunit SecE [Pseudenhygromyxa sp. WMMC2535]|uniref:preprotein translocase subunit SecE n=1 Tax=Pseudenhygromyxa sp. WMMC2535 TaxID=2712867 RepID=UPI001595EEA7|nr:preprotein translocase subunit SecE [Pseudenhygromyxa sp. WMMC2535]NVB36834.1 preprotein translocase subunit SecE [Pseudenhygromyxa sp. WMMC2535]